MHAPDSYRVSLRGGAGCYRNRHGGLLSDEGGWGGWMGPGGCLQGGGGQTVSSISEIPDRLQALALLREFMGIVCFLDIVVLGDKAHETLASWFDTLLGDTQAVGEVMSVRTTRQKKPRIT